MEIPPFNPEGFLPPYISETGPGGNSGDMSPYMTNSLQVVTKLGTTQKRRTLLRGWLNHRSALANIGFGQGFQWLDGSFVERKEPKDLDVVTFIHRPLGFSAANIAGVMQANPNLFQPASVRQTYGLDLFAIDLNGSPEVIIGASAYFMGLFSHRREDERWKGMIQVNLQDDLDVEALAAIDANATD